MGASFVTRQLPGSLSTVDVRKKFETMQDQDRYENGHSYSGGIGMATGLEFRNDVSFNTFAEAEEWLDENAQKWDDALCVKVNLGPGEFAWYIGACCAS